MNIMIKYQTIEESQRLFDITPKIIYTYPSIEYEEFFNRIGNGEYIACFYIKLYKKIPTKEDLQKIYRYYTFSNSPIKYKEQLSNNDIWWALRYCGNNIYIKY